MMRFKLVSTLVVLTVFSALVVSQTPSGHALFEQALAKERVEGNLPEAIKLYERVVTEFASDRALAARALMQVGLSYEKLGRDDAVRAYERLVREFADQADAVGRARTRLAVLKRPAPVAAAGTTMPAVRAIRGVDNKEVLAVSPDGTKSAFISYDKGQNLAIYDEASQQTTPLTHFDWTPASSGVYYAAWSPDGRRIAYQQYPNGLSERARELRVVTLAGESTLIARNEADIAPGGWLPDGSAIVVALMRLDRTATIGLMPTDGRAFIPLRSISGWRGAYPPVPRVSPDGRWIAFVEGSAGDIHVISRDARAAHRITDHPADDNSPLWSPDGRFLAFLSDRGGSDALWAVEIRDGQAVAEPVRLKDGMNGVYPLMGWTTRGLAYGQYQATQDIYTVPVDPASGQPNGSPRMVPYARTGQNNRPDWSPDGKNLAFVFGEGPTGLALVLLPSGGGEPREFPFPNRTNVFGMRWFGDSRGLGFTGIGARGEPTLFRLTLATGEWKTFPLPVPAPNYHRIEWNADGSRYIYARPNLNSEGPAIVERDLQSDRERILFRGNHKDDRYSEIRLSPDRRLLAMIHADGSVPQQGKLVVLEIETGKTPVTYVPAAGETFLGSLTWSPSGRALLVQTRTAEGTMELRRIPTDGGEARRIPLGPEFTRLLSPGGGAPTPSFQNVAWSPDGSRLVFALRATRLDHWMIENPLEGVRK